jgi:hypothetical protein
LVELAAVEAMHKRLGAVLAEPYDHGEGGMYAKAAKACMSAGTVLLAASGRRRSGALVGGALLLAGSVCQRFAVWKAGVESASNPKYTVVPQREGRQRLPEESRT